MNIKPIGKKKKHEHHQIKEHEQEQKLKDNIEACLKYPNQLDRFADSEINLHKLSILAGVPKLYLDLINLNAIPSILNLLAHDNTDIAVDVVQLLQDLIDPNVFEDDEESDESARVLVDTLLENNVLELLVQNLQRLNDFDLDEMATVYSMLTTVENLVEVKPAVAEMVCERTKLLKWLPGKITVREFDSNKQYTSEILAILLRNSATNQRRVRQMNGVDVVLQVVVVMFMLHPLHCLLFKKCGGRVLSFNVSLVIEEMWVVASWI